MNNFYLLSLSNENEKETTIISNLNSENNPFLRIDFDIRKIPYQGLNQANVSIYGLNPEGAPARYSKVAIETQKKIKMSLEVGTDNQPTLIFNGNILEAQPDTVGLSPIFNMEGYEGLYNVENTIAGFQITKDATYSDLKKQLADRLGVNLVSNSINDNQKLQKDTSIDGANIYEEFKNNFPKEEIYIDNNKIYTYDENYFKSLKGSSFSKYFLINEKNAIKRPKRKGQFIHIEILCNPSITLNSLIQIEAEVDPYMKTFNKNYIVKGLRHHGYISYTDGSLLKSELELLNL